MSEATGVARSTINRGLVELRRAEPLASSRIRRPGGGHKQKIERESGLLEALATLVQSAIRSDPQAALLWVSKSQRHLASTLGALGFTVGQKLVGRLLRRELRPKRDPKSMRVHDFAITELGKVAPYGVYDIAANAGWINLGITHDTAAFAVESIRRWWHELGRAHYPQAQ